MRRRLYDFAERHWQQFIVASLIVGYLRSECSDHSVEAAVYFVGALLFLQGMFVQEKK